MDLYPLLNDALFRVIIVPLLILHSRALELIDLGIVDDPTGKCHCVSAFSSPTKLMRLNSGRGNGLKLLHRVELQKYAIRMAAQHKTAHAADRQVAQGAETVTQRDRQKQRQTARQYEGRPLGKQHDRRPAR